MPAVSVARRALVAEVESLGQEALTTLADLSRSPAIARSCEGYLECTNYIAQYLDAAGLSVQRLEVPEDYLRRFWGKDLQRSHEYLPTDRLGPRTIVIGRWPGSTSEPGLHLTNHYDVWKWGEQELAGTVSQLVAVKALKRAGVQLRRDLYVSATPDNHLGGETGAGYLTEQGLGKSPLVISSAPGGVRTVTLGYKGALWIKITTHGQTAACSRPHQGVNAIEGMMRVQQQLALLNERYSTRRSEWPISPSEAARPTLVMSRIMASDSVCGVWIPDTCSLYVDRRLTPEESTEQALEEIRAAVGLGFSGGGGEPPDVEVVHLAENSATSASSMLARTLARNIREVVGQEPRNAVWSYYTEFRFFPTAWGADTVNYSPGRPSSADLDQSIDEIGGPLGSAELLAGIKVLALSVYDLLC